MGTVTTFNIAGEKIMFDFGKIKEKCGSGDYGLYQIYEHHGCFWG
jgi:hypothetical protein